MDAFFIGLSLVVLFPIIMILVRIKGRFTNLKRWQPLFSHAVETFGFTYQEGGIIKSPEISGTIGDIRITVSVDTVSKASVYVFLAEFPRLRTNLRIIPESMFQALRDRFGRPDLQMRDQRFDDTVLIQGDDIHEVRAVLHPEAKAIILGMVERTQSNHFFLRSTKLEINQTEVNFNYDDGLTTKINSILRLIHLLSRQGSTSKLLRENYQAEQKATAKKAYLASLLSLSSNLEEDDSAIKDALQSHDAELVLLAVKARGESGYNMIPKLLITADAKQAELLLTYAQEKNRKEITPAILSHIHSVIDMTVRGVIARFLGNIGDSGAAVDFLQKEIQNNLSTNKEYSRECIRSIGRIGTQNSLTFLDGIKNRSLHNDINSAIFEIRKRIGIQNEGLLSMPDGKENGGQLSLSGEDSSRPADPE